MRAAQRDQKIAEAKAQAADVLSDRGVLGNLANLSPEQAAEELLRLWTIREAIARARRWRRSEGSRMHVAVRWWARRVVEILEAREDRTSG